MASSEVPHLRRVSPRTRSLNRSNAAGAIRRFGTAPVLKLKLGNFRRPSDLTICSVWLSDLISGK